jgi:DNA polymerase III delta prime subunit
MKVRVATADIEREWEPACRQLAQSGLPQILAEVDPGAFGTTPMNLQALDATAHGLAVAAAAAKKLNVLGVLPLYVAFLMAEEAADQLAALGGCWEPSDRAELPPGEYDDFASISLADLPVAILKDCAAFMRFYQRHSESAKRLHRDSESLRCLHAYFRLLSRMLRKLQPEPTDLQVETPRLRVIGWRVSPVGTEEPTDLLPVTFEDIVGNQELVKAGKRLARDIAGFDVKTGKNPKKVRNQVLFVLGTPGCGKTVTAHAIGRYFLQLCEKAQLPARMRVIRRTDWASAYQNQSANSLLEIFKQEVFNAPGVCGVYWPDIDTAFAARSDAEIRQEEKVILSTIFGILDGTIGPKNGRWFMICDANNMNMDEATISRISQNPIRALGPVSAADFIKLFRDIKLRGKGPWLPVTDSEWMAIGDKCVAEKLSGRSVDHLAGRGLTEIEDFEEPEDYFSLSFEDKQKMIAELSRPIAAQRIHTLIEEYCRFEREAQEKSETERFINRVREIRLHLSAQRAAMGVSVESPANQKT